MPGAAQKSQSLHKDKHPKPIVKNEDFAARSDHRTRQTESRYTLGEFKPAFKPTKYIPPPFSQPQTRKGKLTVEHHLISAPSQTSDSSYTSSRAQDSTLAMSRFLSRKSDLGDRLLMQAEAQDRPTGQQYDKNRMGLSSHGFEFPKNNNREGRVQPSEVQRSNNMDALLSQIGAWQRDSGVDIREELHGRRDVRR